MAELNVYTSPTPTVAPGNDPRHAPWGQRPRPRFPVGDDFGTPRGPASPVSARPILTAEVLLGAQQLQSPERVRAFDVRAAYGQAGADRRAQGTAPFESEPDIPDADIALATSQAQARNAPTTGASNNVIDIFGGPRADEAEAAPRAHHTANQAYVNAGGTDGRTFAHIGSDAAHPLSYARVDISI